MNTNNIYGIQKISETEVRDGLDVATGAATGAAQGAKMLSSFGPYGAIAGGVIGGTIGLAGEVTQRNEEKRRSESDKKYNTFVSSLSGRQASNSNYVPAQARKGIKLSKYTQVEAEGDGSKSVSGVGEFHLDKNYNLKGITSGEPTHEQGGKKILMGKGDIILSPRNQNDNSPLGEQHRKKFNQLKAAISRYKLTGDKQAKKYIDDEVSKVPTNVDEARKGARPPFVEDFEENSNPFGTDNLLPDEISKPLSINSLKENATIAPLNKAKEAPVTNWWDEGVSFTKKGDPYEYKANKETGEVVSRKVGSNSPYFSVTEKEKANPKYDNAETYKYVTGEDFVKPETVDPYEMSPAVNPTPSFELLEKMRNKSTENPYAVTDENLPTYNSKKYEQSSLESKAEVPEYNDMWKYSNALYNTGMGAQSIDKVQRRELVPEEYKYQDTSYSQRKAVNSAAQAARMRARGTRLSSGQSISNNSQINAAQAEAMDSINEREAGRRLDVSNQNVGLRNSAKQYNLQAAGAYDQIDAQSKAVKAAYRGEAARDMTKLGQLSEERKYMESRNRKQYAMDKIRMKNLNDIYEKYQMNPDSYDIEFKPKTR
jgi:hypothetical protein